MAALYGGRWKNLGSLKGADRGGQSDVYEVEDLRKEFAGPAVLKRLKIKDAARKARFVSEVKACKTLSHPNIIQIVDHSPLDEGYDPDEKPYIVMPRMAEGSLEKRTGIYKDTLDSTLKVAMALADALVHAHAKAVIHRDVKPANILFASADHVPTLSDFGICFIVGEERVTETGERVGPRDFMAKEFEGGGKVAVTPSVDAYSLGKVIYFMLSGGTTVPREDHAEKNYDFLTARGGRYLMLKRLLDRMICPLEKRVKTMAEVKEELQRISTWEEKQTPLISSGIQASLAKLREGQRTAKSVEEEQARLREEQQIALKGYLDAVGGWLTEQVQELVGQMSAEPDAMAATALSDLQASIQGCTDIEFSDPGIRANKGTLRASRGLELHLTSGRNRRPHRLLFNVYVVDGSWGLPKLEDGDHRIMFVPYYYCEPNSQGFFADPSATTVAQAPQRFGRTTPHARRVAGQPVVGVNGQRSAVLPIDRLTQLCHLTAASRWDEDQGDYLKVVQVAAERFLNFASSDVPTMLMGRSV